VTGGIRRHSPTEGERHQMAWRYPFTNDAK
jgi:hypothetical protein